MSQRQRYFLGVLCVCVTLVFAACERHGFWQPPPPGSPANVSLAIDNSATGGGACMQNGVEGGTAVINSNGVTWAAPTASTTLSIQLQSGANGCGFSQCTFTGTGSVSSGSSNVAAGTVINYVTPNGISIGGTNCNPGSAGLIMR